MIYIFFWIKNKINEISLLKTFINTRRKFIYFFQILEISESWNQKLLIVFGYWRFEVLLNASIAFSLSILCEDTWWLTHYFHGIILITGTAIVEITMDVSGKWTLLLKELLALDCFFTFRFWYKRVKIIFILCKLFGILRWKYSVYLSAWYLEFWVDCNAFFQTIQKTELLPLFGEGN